MNLSHLCNFLAVKITDWAAKGEHLIRNDCVFRLFCYHYRLVKLRELQVRYIDVETFLDCRNWRPRRGKKWFWIDSYETNCVVWTESCALRADTSSQSLYHEFHFWFMTVNGLFLGFPVSEASPSPMLQNHTIVSTAEIALFNFHPIFPTLNYSSIPTLPTASQHKRITIAVYIQNSSVVGWRSS
jgi:hypothetical protein